MQTVSINTIIEIIYSRTCWIRNTFHLVSSRFCSVFHLTARWQIDATFRFSRTVSFSTSRCNANASSACGETNELWQRCKSIMLDSSSCWARSFRMSWISITLKNQQSVYQLRPSFLGVGFQDFGLGLSASYNRTYELLSSSRQKAQKYRCKNEHFYATSLGTYAVYRICWIYHYIRLCEQSFSKAKVTHKVHTSSMPAHRYAPPPVPMIDRTTHCATEMCKMTNAAILLEPSVKIFSNKQYAK